MEEMMVKMLVALQAGEDVRYSHRGDVYYVTVEDFEGFDDDWCEIYRDYSDAALVDEFECWLEEQASSEEDYCYHFDGFSVQLSYSSWDI